MGEADLAEVTAGLEQLQRWQRLLGGPEWSDRLNRSSITGRSSLSAVDAEALTAFVAIGGRVDITAHHQSWTARFTAAPHGSLGVAAGPELYEVFDDDQLQTAERAVAAGDARTLYAMVNARECEFTLGIENSPQRSGFCWVRSRAAFGEMLAQPREGIRFLADVSSTDPAPRLILADIGAQALSCRSIVIHGPDTWPTVPAVAWWSDEARSYVDRFLSRRELLAPPPAGLEVLAHSGLAEEARWLTGWCEALCWWWLASNVAADPAGAIELQFDGARLLTVPLDLQPLDDASVPLETWRWAIESTEADRRDAVQRAVSLAASERSDLRHATPILRNSKWFLDLARRSAVAEAFAARRAARDGALSVARATADAARTAGGKVLDRTVIQAGAAAAILVAQYRALVDQRSAARLLTVVLILILVTGALALFVDFPAAKRPLTDFGKDLGLHREVLSDDDLDAIRSMTALASAQKEVKRYRMIVLGLTLVSAIVLVLLILKMTGSDVLSIVRL